MENILGQIHSFWYHRWKQFYKYGDIEITINLSKPEKDPKEIMKAKTIKASGYPKCLLCKENVGFAGNFNHPARQNHRIIPLTLNGTMRFSLSVTADLKISPMRWRKPGSGQRQTTLR